MRFSRLQVRNFRNLPSIDISLGDHIVIVGENKVGKSNLLHAIRLVLDPALSDRDRTLKEEDFWDGLAAKMGEVIEVSIDLTDFGEDTDEDRRILTMLQDHLVEFDPMVARLTYRFAPRADLQGDPTSTSEYEWSIYGGDDPGNIVGSNVRRRLPIEVLPALRDAERDLQAWRRSPLRPLLEELDDALDRDMLAEVQGAFDQAQATFVAQAEVRGLAERITRRLEDIAGRHHGTALSLRLTSTRAETLVRELRLLIDGGRREMAQASVGTANLIFLTLKSLELDQLFEERDRDHTFLAVEEPEAHLHPHVQRLVYRYLLTGKSAVRREQDPEPLPLSAILTTHSPHIASTAPVDSVVLLRSTTSETTRASSSAGAGLLPSEAADLARYIDVNRGEFYFARGVVLVEGDAERFLVPAFAELLGIHLDELGISVCSVGGTNFAPYVKLLGPLGLNIPHVVLTDLDPRDGKEPLARNRIAKLIRLSQPGYVSAGVATEDILLAGEAKGLFVNETTLEVDLFTGGAEEEFQEVLLDELSLGQVSTARLQGWVDDPSVLEDADEAEKFLAMVERVGKGRMAQQLASTVTEDHCPPYISAALTWLVHALS